MPCSPRALALRCALAVCVLGLTVPTSFASQPPVKRFTGKVNSHGVAVIRIAGLHPARVARAVLQASGHKRVVSRHMVRRAVLNGRLRLRIRHHHVRRHLRLHTAGVKTATLSVSTASCPVSSGSAYGVQIANTAGLAAYWRFGDRSGNVACDSVGGDHGRYTNSYSLGAAGALAGDTDTAVRLSGSGYARVPSSSALSPTSRLTLETWAKPDSVTGTQSLMRKDGQYLLRISGGRPLFRVWQGTSTVELDGPSVLTAGAWQHLVATYDGQSMRLYRNGALIASRTLTGSIATTSSQLNLGSSAGYDYFHGSMDEAAIYNVALSAEQVAAHYGSGTATPSSGGTGGTPTTTTTTTTPTPTPTPTDPPPPSSSAAPACTMFVAPGGSSSSAGSSEGSPTTFASAISKVTAGSVVCLEAGTYNTTGNTILSRSGTASAPITYRNYGGTALVQYTGGSLSGGVLQTSSGSGWGGAHHIVIDGLTIDGNNLIGGGIFVTNGSHHITIRNTTIRNTGATGIGLNATDYVIAEHNMISHVGYNQGWSSGISLWYGGTGATYGGSTAWFDSAPGFHNVIANNIISGAYDNSGNHTDGNAIIIDGSGSIPPALIANNLTYQNGGRGIEVYQNSGNVWVVNNTAYSNGLDMQVGSGQAPDFMAMNATNVHFVNNIAFGRKNNQNFTSAYIYNNTSATINWARNIGYNGSTPGVSSSTTSDTSQYRNTDPQFAAAPPVPTNSTPWTNAVAPWNIGTSLTLKTTSPAINTGINPANATGMTTDLANSMAPYLQTDLAGNPRIKNGTPDLGAYEIG
jgi:hypothetical protein